MYNVELIKMKWNTQNIEFEAHASGFRQTKNTFAAWNQQTKHRNKGQYPVNNLSALISF